MFVEAVILNSNVVNKKRYTVNLDLDLLVKQTELPLPVYSNYAYGAYIGFVNHLIRQDDTLIAQMYLDVESHYYTVNIDLTNNRLLCVIQLPEFAP